MTPNRWPSASRARPALLAALLVTALAGCTGSAANPTSGVTAAASVAGVTASVAAPTPAPTPVPTLAPATSAPADSPRASSAGLDGPTAVPTSLDPCKLFSNTEAGQLAGASFGPGSEMSTSGNARMCTYGGQTVNIFTVEVAVAPSVAVAQADKAQALAEAKSRAPAGLKLTELPNLADGGAMAQGGSPSGTPFDAIGIYVLKGTVFFALVDVVVGNAAPSPAQMQAAAQTVLGRIP